MKKFINKTADGESVLSTLEKELDSHQVITAGLEVTDTIITAHDAKDIAVLNSSSYKEYEPEYASNRKADYPDWGTQLNKIYDDGLTKWKSEMVDPVKAKWPKDNSGPK